MPNFKTIEDLLIVDTLSTQLYVNGKEIKWKLMPQVVDKVPQISNVLKFGMINLCGTWMKYKGLIIKIGLLEKIKEACKSSLT